jgi:hypothetical protein
MIVVCACSEVTRRSSPSLATNSIFLDYGRTDMNISTMIQGQRKKTFVRTHVCSLVPLASTIAPCVLPPLPLDSILVGIDDPASSSALTSGRLNLRLLSPRILNTQIRYSLALPLRTARFAVPARTTARHSRFYATPTRPLLLRCFDRRLRLA